MQGPAQDLHSGSYGGAVVNPAMALARILATMHDEPGKVTIAGSYDDVKPFPPNVIAGMRELPFDEESFRKEVGETAYRSLLPEGQKPPVELNAATMEKFRPLMEPHYLRERPEFRA